MARFSVEATQERIGELDVTMQATKAPEQKDGNQDSQRQQNKLDNRYGKIGISAVAAACAHTGKQEGVSEYRIPYDRD
jgi:hypothetical protein